MTTRCSRATTWPAGSPLERDLDSSAPWRRSSVQNSDRPAPRERTRHGGVELGIVSSKVKAELIVYDGDTMEKLAASELAKRSTSLMPSRASLVDW